MRTSVTLLVIAAGGAVGGAWLVGLWCVGLVLIAESATLAAFALARDVPGAAAQGSPASPAVEALERFRRTA
ncbi:hypothetical protein [Frankia sp. Cj3]|uniref:hypothetical protein n=1 Tax=Frankia sp. Cj3 TaxID=2880976 RepID=UPI001EF5E0C6|nr:hypothetical protein [Frankia sp. Cj3]